MSKFDLSKPFDDIAESLVSKASMEEMHQVILENDSTEFVPATIKNVLFCGASKSGKSTIFNILQNPCYCPQSISLFADTKFTSFKTFSLKDRVQGKVHNFVVNLIDTPGTFEIRADGENFKSRSNEEISGLIIDCINHEITYLNLLVLVISATKFSTTEIESVEIFLEMFGETAVPIILCLTHADSIGQRRRQQVEEELRNYAGLSKFFAKDLFTLQWMGCVNYVGKDYTDEKIMFNDYRLVSKWRNQLVEKIFAADKRVELEQTSIYDNKRTACVACLGLVLKGLRSLAATDILNPVGSQQLELIKHRKNMDFVYVHAFYLEKEKVNKDSLEKELKALEAEPEGKAEEITLLKEKYKESAKVLNDYSDFHTELSNIKKSEKSDEFKELLLSRWM